MIIKAITALCQESLLFLENPPESELPLLLPLAKLAGMIKKIYPFFPKTFLKKLQFLSHKTVFTRQ